MSDLKKDAKIVLLVVAGFLLTSFLIFVGFNSNYKPIRLSQELPQQITIEKAEANKDQGRVYGYVQNSNESNLNGNIIEVFIHFLHSYLPQPIPNEALSGIGKEESYAEGVAEEGNPECCVVIEVFGEDSSENHTQSHTQIPRGENRGIGSASLTVGCQIDKHVLHGGIHVSVAQTDNDGRAIVANGIMECRKEEIAKH